MEDTQNKNDKRKRSRELAEAFMLINTSDTVAEEAMILRNIARDLDAKDSDRISAVRTIWEYAIAKPKQEMELSHHIDNILVDDEEFKEILKKLPHNANTN